MQYFVLSSLFFYFNVALVDGKERAGFLLLITRARMLLSSG